MILDTEQLPDWSIYVFIGGAVILTILTCWCIEYLLGCLTCEPCRKCYKRISQVSYFICCCCLCSNNQKYEEI